MFGYQRKRKINIKIIQAQNRTRISLNWIIPPSLQTHRKLNRMIKFDDRFAQFPKKKKNHFISNFKILLNGFNSDLFFFLRFNPFPNVYKIQRSVDNRQMMISGYLSIFHLVFYFTPNSNNICIQIWYASIWTYKEEHTEEEIKYIKKTLLT